VAAKDFRTKKEHKKHTPSRPSRIGARTRLKSSLFLRTRYENFARECPERKKWVLRKATKKRTEKLEDSEPEAAP
jgi:hypothetical protein